MLRPTPLRALLLALAPAVFTGCSLFGDDVVIGEPVDGPVVLAVRSQPHPTDRLTLAIWTEESYGCLLPLALRASRRGDLFHVEVLGIARVEVCATAVGPAGGAVPLDLPAGDYELRLAHLGREDLYRLVVHADRVELSVVDAAASRAEDPLVWRVPDRSFAFVCGTYTGDEGLCDTFDAQLRDGLDLEPIPIPAEGRWPYPDSSQGHYHDTPTRIYRYEREEDFARAGALLGTFSREVLRGRMGAGLYLRNWRGEEYLSWVLMHGAP